MQTTTSSSHHSTFHVIFKLKTRAITYTEKYQSGSLQYHTFALGPLLFHRLSRPHTATPYPLLTTTYTLLSTYRLSTSLCFISTLGSIAQLSHTLLHSLQQIHSNIVFPDCSMVILSFVPLLQWAQCCLCRYPLCPRVYFCMTPHFVVASHFLNTAAALKHDNGLRLLHQLTMWFSMLRI